MGKHEDQREIDEDFLRQQALGLAKLEELAAAQVHRNPDGSIKND